MKMSKIGLVFLIIVLVVLIILVSVRSFFIPAPKSYENIYGGKEPTQDCIEKAQTLFPKTLQFYHGNWSIGKENKDNWVLLNPVWADGAPIDDTTHGYLGSWPLIFDNREGYRYTKENIDEQGNIIGKRVFVVTFKIKLVNSSYEGSPQICVKDDYECMIKNSLTYDVISSFVKICQWDV